MKRLLGVGLLCTLVTVPFAGNPADAGALRYLTPGKQAALRERVPVNVVFVGLDRRRIDQDFFEVVLPRTYRPVLRAASIIRGKPQPLGITYTYDYRLMFAPRSYADSFFSFLARSAKPAPLTYWQSQYNAQLGRRDIESNHAIDAPTVERWLAANPPKGVDTTKNTVFLIDWYGRKDFRDHVYTKAREPDLTWAEPSTASESDRDVFIAWGGTAADDPEDGKGRTRRVWFYDASAGPDYWSGNWDVTTTTRSPAGTAPLDPSRRVWPSWEYADDGARPAVMLEEGLAAITRYVAIDLLFTPSPLYPAIMTSRGRPGSIELDVNFYDAPGAEASRAGSKREMVRMFHALAPWLRFSADAAPADFAQPEHVSCFAQFTALALVEAPPCYPDARYNADANLVLYHSRNRDRFFDGGAEYQAGAFSYQVPGPGGGCYAYADDDRRTGAQTFVFAFVPPECVEGWTDLLVHEFGHHVGLSHPHDGYDSEEKKDFGPSGDFAFAFTGTEVNSAMAYHAVNNEFSQFDADNFARFETEAHVTSSNLLAKRLIGAEVDGRALRQADELIGSAYRAFAGHRYREAAVSARRAYVSLAALAQRARVRLDVRTATAPGYAGPVRSGRDGLPLPPAFDRICAGMLCR